MKTKVSIIGAGNVGAAAAQSLAQMKVVDEIVLLDIRGGVPQGKAMDIMQAGRSLLYDTVVTGVTNDYSATEGSDIVLITSGVPRKPGMTREELVGVNSGVMTDVLDKVSPLSPKAIYVVVSNPMDTMTYYTIKHLGIDPKRVIGMGGDLDSSRFCYYLAEALHTDICKINGWVLGGHGDKTMVPIVTTAKYLNTPVTELLSKQALESVVFKTMNGGAVLTGLIGTSAWVAPGACAAALIRDIITDSKMAHAVSVYDPDLDVCYGQVAYVGRWGVEGVVETPLTREEKALIEKSALAVRDVNKALPL